MKRILAIALLATTIAFGQTNKKSGWERASLKGKVKTSLQTGYQLADDGKQIPMNSEIFVQYDKNGNTVKMISKQNGLVINFVDTYDEKGLLSESASKDDSNTLLSKNLYEYDERGNLTRHDVETPSGEIFMSRLNAYDANDRLIERSECMVGICDEKIVYIYNADNKVSEENHYSKEKLSKKVLFTYDAKGNIVEKRVVDAENALQQRVVSTFDANDNAVEVKYFDKEGKVSKTETYLFVYDKKKNWTKKTMSVNGKPEIVFVQKLKYY